ncbi:uncharacterized protein METZ01_LOCUS392449 [marine metagenome]|uniref:Uncharacterized protein n=1 Tax=marine metagenome TaxID=408172 RepID=A0A382V0P5_9ZZZZ
MASEKKIAQVTKPIPMEQALKMYGVSSEEELKELFRELFNPRKRNFFAELFRKILNFFGFGNNH